MALTSTADVSRHSAAAPAPGESLAKLYEQALTLTAMGLREEAMKVLRDVTARAPGHGPAWQTVAELLRLAGRDDEARAAAARAASATEAWPPAADPRTAAEIDDAERALRERMRELVAPPEQLKALRLQLRGHETDAAAMRVLASLESRRGDLMTARGLLERALDLAPDYEGARADLAQLLHYLREDTRALTEVRQLIDAAPANVAYRALYADTLRVIGDGDAAISVLGQLVQDEPEEVRFRCVYAQSLRVAGRREESAREFRTCLAQQPDTAEAYWGLAELRGDFLTARDIDAIRELQRDTSLEPSSRMLLQNALGQALERAGDYAASFAAYEAGAALSREICANRGQAYNRIRDADEMASRRAVFTAPFLAARAAPPAKTDCTPIFVVGMPRAGSTLVEQILASHSLVEGTMELPVLCNIAHDLSRHRLLVMPDAYPECVPELSDSELAELGARYLEETAVYRKTKCPYFVDKRPWNWLETGLIRTILPHAKIIDVRREPRAACFAVFKHMMANDTAYPHDLTDLAHHYVQYADLMAHYDRAMPGHIHFVSYERLVDDTETEVRRLLDYCGLAFEEVCLRFWETDRAVATPSSEQVRRPIFRDAVDQWRRYEPWLGPLKNALDAAEAEAAATPNPPEYEFALTLAAMGAHEAAIKQLRDLTARVPDHPGAWQKLADLLRLAGNDEAADQASAAAERCGDYASKWRPARDARTPAQLEAAERKLQAQYPGRDRSGRIGMLRKHLVENPTDAAATHMLSGLQRQNGEELPSLTLLERTVELSPSYNSARAELVVMLIGFSFWARALGQSTILMRQAPWNPEYRAIHCDALKGVDDFAGAMATAEELLREHPRNPRFWFGYGDLLHHFGRRDESARAFRTCLDLDPSMGRAYWRLADLKSGFLTDADIGTMRQHLADPALDSDSRMYMNYALAHALEYAKDFPASFAAYQKGARLFRGCFMTRGEAYNEDVFLAAVRGRKRVYTAQNLAGLAAPRAASPAVIPIFVVGMPRAGSTLVEQILSSHSHVEGTRELPLIGGITKDLELSRILVKPNAYPDCILDMAPPELASLGERYLREARLYRKTERPYFVDKRPWNWMEAGLIQLILPHAKIIDVRREPMAACFGMFKQVLPDADFSYDLHDLGRYYTEYVGLMNHYAAEMPGRIHFVQYERLVEDTENEIRRMLNHCGLPFEEGCLRFWETDRIVTTPSAEQVRRPIYRDALRQWRNFEPWLGPLNAALSAPPQA